MDSGFTIGVGLIPIAVTLVLSGIGAVVWLVRLEAGMKSTREDLKQHRDSQREHNRILYQELRTANNNLHRIMGKLGIEPSD